MNRRTFFQTCIGAAGAITLRDRADAAGLPKTKITRIRYYKTPTDAAGRPNNKQPLFNQSTNVVLVETDAGLVGVGEGGSGDTMEQCAGLLIGEDPFRTDRLWQSMYRAYFYPAGEGLVFRTREHNHGNAFGRRAFLEPPQDVLAIAVWHFLIEDDRLGLVGECKTIAFHAGECPQPNSARMVAGQ
jgi:hypothetical protein